jgi:2-methylcitrate dehydratase PrpD
MPDLHPSGAVVAAALAAAVAIGLELAIRLDRAAFDAKVQTSGFLAGRLLGLDAVGIGHAIAIAVSLASGSLEANRSGGDIKQFQSGWAAKSAIQAAQLARLGVTSPELALEGRYGFFRCFAGGTFDADVLAGGLGRRWLSCRHCSRDFPPTWYASPCNRPFQPFSSIKPLE